MMATSIEHETQVGSPEVHGDSATSPNCLIWRCLSCGAAWLGDIDHEPTECPKCHGVRLEFAQED
jgi:rubrerythrin